MQCNKFDCKNHFHATCAQEKGLLFVEPGDSNSEVKYFGYCQKHYTRHMERVGQISSFLIGFTKIYLHMLLFD